MEFKKIVSSKTATRGPLAASPASREQESAPAEKPAETAANNLLKHIPGEASGFYLLSVSSLGTTSEKQLGIVFVLSLILLLVVRMLAKASMAIILTSVGAFLLWMQIIDIGFLHVLFPNLLDHGMGLVLAIFYSAVVTAFASAGKLK